MSQWKPIPRVVRWQEVCEHWEKQTKVPAALLLGFIQQESGGYENCTRYEPAYEKKYCAKGTRGYDIAKKCGMTTHDVATSYGLMQLMFPLAYGYGARSRADAFNPIQNIRYGAAHIAALAKQFNVPFGGEGILRVAGAYNGAGSTSGYARNVLALYRNYETWRKGE